MSRSATLDTALRAHAAALGTRAALIAEDRPGHEARVCWRDMDQITGTIAEQLGAIAA
jgi:acyl-CoA synthetase (AMP-forming)/AMP-acid ligase II